MLPVGRNRRIRCRLEAVDGGGARRGRELRAIGVLRRRVGLEVVVEGNVLLEDHHEVLDRRGCAAVLRSRSLARSTGARRRGSDRHDDHDDEQERQERADPV